MEQAAVTKPKRKPKILLGVTGSVAAVKSPELAVELTDKGFEVCIVLTTGGLNFWEKSPNYNSVAWNRFEHFQNENRIRIVKADDEWRDWNVFGDPVQHIELRNWADILLIAPLSAHTLAKLANGLCDDTLSCVCRAWKFPSNTLFLAPAMNTAMWEHPVTEQQIATITTWGATVIAPQSKMLACGEVGNGAMASVESIVRAIKSSANMT